MELIDRYLQAVKFWLPRTQRDDIIAELSEDIRSQIEDKEAELGRKVNDAELAAVLKRLGHPLLVAHRFLPQQYLIGPVLFPMYQFVLKIAMVCYLAPWTLVLASLMIFNPAYRAAHSGGSWLGLLGSLWGSLWLIAFDSVGVVTLVFAIVERVQAYTGFPKDWDPRKLPVVRDPNRIPRSTSIFELVVGIIFIIWWVSSLGFRTIFEFSGARVTLAPEWRYFLCGLLLVSLVNAALSGVNLFRRCWTRLRAGIRLASDSIGSALFCWLLKSAILAEIIVPNVPTAKTLAVTNAINLWAARSFPVAVIGCVVIILFDVRRIFRAKTAVI
jgi:hypothetical protein